MSHRTISGISATYIQAYNNNVGASCELCFYTTADPSMKGFLLIFTTNSCGISLMKIGFDDSKTTLWSIK